MSNWIDALVLLSDDVDDFVSQWPSDPSVNYQLKLDVLRSVLRRSLCGELRHLPSKRSVKFCLELPS